MKLISHRGNINGKNKNRENSKDYIDEAIALGYDVEIDVWFKNGKLSLGHDEPQYDLEISWLDERKDFLWVHCKNVEALIELIDTKINCFYHVEDVVTLTSNKTIWAFPGKQPIEKSIAVLPEVHNDDLSCCIGVCSDFVEKYKKD
jgi:hypothetical protein